MKPGSEKGWTTPGGGGGWTLLYFARDEWLSWAGAGAPISWRPGATSTRGCSRGFLKSYFALNAAKLVV